MRSSPAPAGLWAQTTVPPRGQRRLCHQQPVGPWLTAPPPTDGRRSSNLQNGFNKPQPANVSASGIFEKSQQIRTRYKDDKVHKRKRITCITPSTAHSPPRAEGASFPSRSGQCLEETTAAPVPCIPPSVGAEPTPALSVIYHGVVIN